MAEQQVPVEKLSYEAALADLEGLIAKLEAGSIDLADAIACYERGVALAGRCGRLLEETQAKVQKLVLGPRAELTEQDLE